MTQFDAYTCKQEVKLMATQIAFCRRKSFPFWQDKGKSLGCHKKLIRWLKSYDDCCIIWILLTRLISAVFSLLGHELGHERI